MATISNASAIQDPRVLQVHRPSPQRDVPYVPTELPVADAMLKLARVREGDVVYDLGCGDGRICMAAAQLGARAVGVDIDRLRIRECHWNAQRAGVLDRVEFRCRSFFDLNLSDASVVTLFLLTRINIRLRPKLLWDLTPGTRIVANTFDLGDWSWDAKMSVNYRTLYLWVVPAWVEGRWRCVLNTPDRQRMTLDLRRRYQFVSGRAGMGRRRIPLINGRLVGDRLSFTLPTFPGLETPTRFGCHFDGKYLRGTCQPKGGRSLPVQWVGTRW